MKNGHVKTWTDYINFQFLFRIRRHFANGAQTVILAFDNYDHVPTAKGMTQAKRRKHLPPVNEEPSTPLPPFIPDEWDTLIMNRTFKTKVIKMVTERLPGLMRLKQGQRLVIDFAGNPIAYTTTGCEEYEDLPALGEADVKFTRYGLPGVTYLLDAIDGDYIPIALMHHEHILQQKLPPPRVYVYRMECKIETKGKRVAGGTQTAPKRSYEYVSISILYATIKKRITQVETPFHADPNMHRAQGNEMRMIAGLIALTGCDFTKGLAQISPKRVWDMLPVLWGRVKRAYDIDTGLFDPQMLTDLVVARLYAHIYAKHVPSENMHMEQIAAVLKKSTTLSATTRDKLPAPKNVVCIARNCNWVMEYWRCPLEGGYPDPMQGDFGFTTNHKGAPQWEDDAATEPPPRKRKSAVLNQNSQEAADCQN